jgi:hypothetical protein
VQEKKFGEENFEFLKIGLNRLEAAFLKSGMKYGLKSFPQYIFSPNNNSV